MPALLGLVATGVIGFEAVSGIQPACEALARSLHWMILLPPALLAAASGARIRRRLGPVG